MDNADDILGKLKCLIDRHDLDCKLCHRLFDDPRNLHCGHSFCFNCIEGHITSTEEDNSFLCPTCDNRQSVPIDGASKVRKDILLNTMIEARDLLHEGATVRCFSCDHNRAAHACYTCSCFLCSRCLDNHADNQPGGVKHESETLRNLRNGENFIRFQKCRHSVCARHPNKKNSLFCKYDELCICEQCAGESNHKGHFVLGIEDKVNTEIADLESKFKSFEEEKRDLSKSLVLLRGKEKSLLQNARDLCEEIDRRVQELSRKVKEYGHKLKKDVNSKVEVKTDILLQKIEKYQIELDKRDKVLRDVSVLHCMPMSGVLEVCRSIQRTADKCKNLDPVAPEHLEQHFTPAGFTVSTMDDPFLVAAFKSLFGFVTPVSRTDRKCNKPSTGMAQDMQDEALECIQKALDSLYSLEHRPTTYTKIAQKVCERFRAIYSGRMWQCIVGTPGQLGFNIACSRESKFTVVIGGIEVTLFHPKL